MQKLLKIGAGLALLAGVGYVAIFKLPPLMEELHQVDARETARETGVPTAPANLPKAVAPTGISELTCGSDDSKKLVAQVIGKNPPDSLLTEAGQEHFSELFDQDETRKACDITYKAVLADIANGSLQDSLGHTSAAALERRDACVRQANDPIHGKIEKIKSYTAYALKDIRLQSRDATTGAIVCKATLHAELPQNYGTAEEEVEYKIEKMEDGGLHIDMAGLN